MRSTESRITRLEAMIAQIASAVGVSAPKDTPRTSARIAPARPNVSNMASKKTQDDILIENVGGNRSDGRMRLPARMFGSRDTITVDGHKFTKLETDGNRSANFNPAVIGAETGDDVVFVHLGGPKWEAAVHSSSRKKKAKASVKAKIAPKAKAKAPAPKGVKTSGKLALVKQAAKDFGLKARKNAQEGFENENILEFTKFEDDPRQYLTSRENAQAKRIWKGRAGMTLSQWVELLSDEVYG